VLQELSYSFSLAQGFIHNGASKNQSLFIRHFFNFRLHPIFLQQGYYRLFLYRGIQTFLKMAIKIEAQMFEKH